MKRITQTITVVGVGAVLVMLATPAIRAQDQTYRTGSTGQTDSYTQNPANKTETDPITSI